MEDTDEFKWAVKVVIKRQMRDLMEQLRERGEEIAILTVNLDDNSCSHFGSPNGEWFVSEQKNLAQNFLKFCKTKDKNWPSTDPSPQKGTRHSYGSTQGTKSSVQKQKSTPSTGSPTLTVTVPKQLAGDITEEELAALVGRVVACQLAVREKGDGSSGGTKFDLLVEAANQSKKKDEAGSVLSTPSTRSTRKRKLTAKYLEGMSSLKKGKRPEEEDTGSEQETGQEENVILSMLTEISNTVLKRVKVKTSDGTPVHIEKSPLTQSESLESLAVLVIQELDEMAGGMLSKEKNVQVTVCIDENSRHYDYIQIKVNGILRRRTDDSDFDAEAEMLDFDDGDSDMEDSFLDPIQGDINITHTVPLPPVKLKKRPKRKTPLSKSTLMPCEHCGKTISGRNNLIAHIKRIHLKEKDHKCKVCPKAFNTCSALDSHMLAVHTRRCEKCQEYVIESVPWSEGMNMKTLRKVECQCGEMVEVYCHFGRRRVYEDETETDPAKKRKYNDQTKYACQHCGKLFVSKAHCIRHARKHTGIKDIECEYCQERFRYKNSLKKHLQKEHRIFQTFFCKLCNLKLDSAAELNKHNKTYHAPDSPEEIDSLEQSVLPEKLVKVVTNVITHHQTHKGIPGTSPSLIGRTATSNTGGTSQQEVSLQNDLRTSLQSMLGTSQTSTEPEVAMRTVGGHAIDKDTYELVQQALQGDQMYTEDGNTIIIRTVPS